MKKIFFLIFLLSLAFHLSAQEKNTPKKLLYKYTFEGMKDSSEVTQLNKVILQLKDVVSSNVIFKSADHQYALLKVEVMIPETMNESSSDVTGPSDLKKVLSRLGYLPAECKTYSEN